MKPPKRLTQVLAVATLGVWGAVAYQFFFAINTPEGEADGSETKQTARTAARFVYAADVRDPFQRPFVRDTSHVHKSKQAPPLWIPPPFKVNGIIGENGRKAVILESAGGSVSFLAEGDTLLGVKILKVSKAKVEYSYMKKRGEWLIEGQ